MRPEGQHALALAAADRCLLGLSIAVDHPGFSKDPLVLCSAARACKGWRQAVQQCGACNTVIVIGPDFASRLGESAPLVKLSSFAQWLPRHAALVRSIAVDMRSVRRELEAKYGYVEVPLRMPVHSFAEIAQQLMQPAMQLAAASGLAPPPPAAAAAAASDHQQGRSLRLVSFASDLAGMPAMLSALPGHSLTCLDLDLWPSRALSGPGLAAALARLSNLQQLGLIKTYGTDCAIPSSCLEGVAQLSRLTSLSLAGRWTGGLQPLQQLLAQPQALPLRQLHLALNMHLSKLDMSRCTDLQELSIRSPWELPKGSALPLQLQRLELFNELVSTGDQLAELQLSQLQQLQTASLHISMTAQSLQDMNQLPSLQHLALGCYSAAAAQQTAATWQQLPQLRELTVLYTQDPPDGVRMSAILAGVGACSSLTKLQLEVRAVRVEQQEEEEELDDPEEPDLVEGRVFACGSLTRLTNLRDLDIVDRSQLQHGDALQLTALTGLTSLTLAGLGEGVGELAATAIACCLRQLCRLDLQDCDLGSMACLAAVAHLTGLTRLKLEGNSGLTREGLLLLTKLSKLQKLGVDNEALLSPFAWKRFWAAVRRQ